MTQQESGPVLKTRRLILRPFTLADAGDVQRLAGDADVALKTANIPHPYEDGMAEQWISTHAEKFAQGTGVALGIVLREDGSLMGCMSLMVDKVKQCAELGYWIGKPYWNRGYCTEAARAVVGYGFEHLGLKRVYACYLRSNPASGRVMQKLGMKYERRLPKHAGRGRELEDLEFYGMLRQDYRPGE